MNGRVYDPQLGRFMSVDPVFQFPTNTQSLNPYSYVLNSPLTMTDPTGLESVTPVGGDPLWGEWMLGMAGWSAASRGGLQSRLNAWKAQALEWNSSDTSKVGSLSHRSKTEVCNDTGCKRVASTVLQAGTGDVLSEIVEDLTHKTRPLDATKRKEAYAKAREAALVQLSALYKHLANNGKLKKAVLRAFGLKELNDATREQLLAHIEATYHSLASVTNFEESDHNVLEAKLENGTITQAIYDARMQETASVDTGDPSTIRINKEVFFDTSRDADDYALTMMHEGSHFAFAYTDSAGAKRVLPGTKDPDPKKKDALRGPENAYDFAKGVMSWKP